jgi:hypothetical protein
MGLFNRIRRLFVKDTSGLESEVPREDISQEEYASNYVGNRQKISTDAMDVLMLEEDEEEQPLEPVIMSEYDAGDVDFSEFDSKDLEDNSVKNVVVYESFEHLDEHLEGAEIIGDIPGEVSFDLEQNE